MSYKTYTQLVSENTSSFADNTSGNITPQIVRTYNKDLLDHISGSTYGGVLTKVLPIGGWDMQNNATHQVDISGLVTYNKIIDFSCVIFSNGTNYTITNLNSVVDEGGTLYHGSIVITTNGTNSYVNLYRPDASYWATTSFSGTSSNRGYVIVKSLP